MLPATMIANLHSIQLKAVSRDHALRRTIGITLSVEGAADHFASQLSADLRDLFEHTATEVVKSASINPSCEPCEIILMPCNGKREVVLKHCDNTSIRFSGKSDKDGEQTVTARLSFELPFQDDIIAPLAQLLRQDCDVTLTVKQLELPIPEPIKATPPKRRRKSADEDAPIDLSQAPGTPVGN